MEIERSHSWTSGKGSAEQFTATVGVDPQFRPPDLERAFDTNFTLESDALSVWHRYTLGKIVIVMAGYDYHRYEAHRHCGTTRWQELQQDEKGQRRMCLKSKPTGASKWVTHELAIAILPCKP